MVFANKTLFVTSEQHQWLPALARSALTRIDFSQPQPIVTVQWVDGYALNPSIGLARDSSVAAFAEDRLVMIAQAIVDGGYGAPCHHLTSLSQPGPIINAGIPWYYPTPGMAFNTGLVVRGSEVWSLGQDLDDNDNPVLYRLNLNDLSWWWYPWPGQTNGGCRLAKARDAYVDDIYVSFRRTYGHPQPTILAIQQPSLAEQSIPLAHDPLMIHTVPVP
jgi:hypothetical protein